MPTTVHVKDKVKEDLKDIKEEEGLTSLNDAIALLLKAYKKEIPPRGKNLGEV